MGNQKWTYLRNMYVFFHFKLVILHKGAIFVSYFVWCDRSARNLKKVSLFYFFYTLVAYGRFFMD